MEQVCIEEDTSMFRLKNLKFTAENYIFKKIIRSKSS